MGFLSPITALVAAGITVPPLVLLYFLKRRHVPVTVSSTLLWARAIRDLQTNRLLQKLRRHLLLLLQLLILAMVLIAVGRPTVSGTDREGDRLIILLDHSASMNATDVAPTRLARAKHLALELVDDLRPNGPARRAEGAMVMSFARRAKVVQPFTTNRTLLGQAIESIQPTDEPTRLASALEIIRPLVSAATSDRHRAIVYVISDGRMQDDKPPTWDAAAFRHIQVGHRPDNLAIVSLSARRDPRDPHRVLGLAQLANFSSHAIDTKLTLKLDGRVWRVVPVTVPGRVANQPVRFDLDLSTAAMLEVSHNHVDPLVVDNTAWMIVTPPQQPAVLLVTTGNAILARAIQASAIGELVTTTPKQYEDRHRGSFSGNNRFDVIVFDRYQPRATPTVNSLFVASAPPLDPRVWQPENSDPAGPQLVLNWKRNHPLMAHVDLDAVRMSKPNRMVLSDPTQVLATGQTGPVMALVTADRLHHVIVGFDPLQSNWPLQVGFPIFIHNCMQWLGSNGHTEAGMTLKPGQDLIIPDDGAGSLLAYEGPVTPWARIESPTPVQLPFARVGLYHARGPVRPPWDRLGVSLLNRTESNLQPVEPVALEAARVGTAGETRTVRHEVWPWFITAALAGLMLEWVVYTQRVHR